MDGPARVGSSTHLELEHVAYCNQTDLELAISAQGVVQLANDSGGATADPTVIARALQHADNRINAIAGRHYAVPFSPVPDFIRDLAVDLALIFLANRRPHVPAWAESRRLRVKADLEALANGTATVGTQPEPARNPQRAALRDGGDPTFTRNNLDKF